jgi:hypothetical protein
MRRIRRSRKGSRSSRAQSMGPSVDKRRCAFEAELFRISSGKYEKSIMECIDRTSPRRSKTPGICAGAVDSSGGYNIWMQLSREERKALERALLSKVKREKRCWVWFGNKAYSSRNAPRYGVVRSRILKNAKNRFGKIRAHRLSYLLFKGPIADGLVVDHICENTLCVNPAHLEAVSGVDNTGRYHGRRTYLCARCIADFVRIVGKCRRHKKRPGGLDRTS